MENKKGGAGIILLVVVSLLIVSSGLIISIATLQKGFDKNKINTNDDLIYNELPSLSLPEDKEEVVDNSFSGGGGGSGSSNNKEDTPTIIERLESYGEDYEDFQEIEINDKTILYSQRTISGAIVEKDFKVYQFDTESGELIGKIINWREDLPEEVSSEIITQEEAEALVEGEIQFSKLYIISNESYIFSTIEPTPENPCWVVAITNEYGYLELIIIDAVTGENLGKGIAPPSDAFALGGPQDFYPCENPFSTALAENWFSKMHYDTESIKLPNESQVQSQIQSNETILFYEMAHGDSDHFTSGCTADGLWGENTDAWEVENWIADYNKKAFTFLGSCDAMCNTGEGTLSYAFRKGSDEDTVTVGHCGMGGVDCFDCWQNSHQWENKFFELMNGGFYGTQTPYTIKEAFDAATSEYPMCSECVGFEGDENLKLVTCDETWGESYCCDWGGTNSTCKNTTCNNLAGVSFTKPYSETPMENCGESYCKNWSENYCKEGNVYHKRTCYDKGCAVGACYNTEYEQEEIVEACEYGCENAQCLYPDLVVEDLIFQEIVGQKVVLAFTIKNIGDVVTDSVYWMIDTNSSNTNPEKTIPVSLESEEGTRAYMMWTYSSPGTYNPRVIVDFDNVINESNEGNNEESIEVIVN